MVAVVFVGDLGAHGQREEREQRRGRETASEGKRTRGAEGVSQAREDGRGEARQAGRSWRGSAVLLPRSCLRLKTTWRRWWAGLARGFGPGRL